MNPPFEAHSLSSEKERVYCKKNVFCGAWAAQYVETHIICLSLRVLGGGEPVYGLITHRCIISACVFHGYLKMMRTDETDLPKRIGILCDVEKL